MDNAYKRSPLLNDRFLSKYLLDDNVNNCPTKRWNESCQNLRNLPTGDALGMLLCICLILGQECQHDPYETVHEFVKSVLEFCTLLMNINWYPV